MNSTFDNEMKKHTNGIRTSGSETNSKGDRYQIKQIEVFIFLKPQITVDK